MTNISEKIMAFRLKARESFNSAPYFWAALFGVVFVPLFVSPISSEVTKTSLLVIFAGWSLFYLFRSKAIKLPVSALVLLALFLIFVFISGVSSGEPWQFIIGRSSRYNNSLLIYTSLSVLFIALTTGWKKVNERIILHCLLLCGLAIAFFGVLQVGGIGYFAGIQSLIIPGFNRVPSLVGNPNFSSWIVACALPAAYLLIMSAKGMGEKWYSIISVVIMWVSLGFFASRGALFAAMTAAFCFIVYLLWKRGIKPALISFLGIAFLVSFTFVWALFYHPGLQAGLNSGEQNTASRLYVWSEALIMMADKPLTGTGPGGFLTHYMRFAADPVSQEGWFDDPHNMLLNLGSTLGIPAMLVFASFVVLALWRALVRVVRSEDDELSYLYGFMATVTFLLASMLNPVTSSLWIFFMAPLAACYFSEGAQVHNLHKKLSLYLPKIASVFGIVLVLLGFGWMISDYTSSFSGQLYSVGKTAAASKLVQISHYLWPANFASSLIYGATSISSESSWPKASSRLQNTTNRYSQDPIIQLQAARIYWMRYDRSKDEKDAVMATYMAERARNITPNAPDPYTMLGFFEFAKGDTDKAIQILETAVLIDRDDLASWQLLAAAYQKQGNRHKMLGALKELVRIRPTASYYRKAKETAQNSERIDAVNLQVGRMEVFF